MSAAAMDRRSAVRSRLADMATVAYRVFWLGDTTTIRTLLAVASIGFAGLLWWHPEFMDRAHFAGMRWTFVQWAWSRELGPVNCWAALFLMHGAGVFWRLWDPVRRVYWAVAINALGFFVWLVSTALINYAAGAIAPGTALEITVVAAAFVALVRTGLNDEKVEP